MNEPEFRKIIEGHGFGVKRGKKVYGIRLFDGIYNDTETLESLDERVKREVKRLKDKGLVYDREGADCDSWVMWQVSGVTQEYALEHAGEGLIKTLRLGRCHLPGRPGHDIVCGFDEKNDPYFWNYGQLIEYDPKKMDEVEVK